MRADKPIGIYLLLWPTLWGLLFAAQGLPALHITLVFCAGVVVMRSAGCVINDFADRQVDKSVERTKNRPLPAGKVTAKEAKHLFAVLIVCAFALVLLLNVATIMLSVVALFLASLYPFMKRHTHLPQVFLGAAFAWSIPMAFMAINNHLPHWMWLLYIANICWTVAYDTQYAMVDRRFDLKVGIKSTAILFASYDLAIITLLQLVSLGLLAWVFYLQNLAWYAYISLIVAALLFSYQFYLCYQRLEQNYFRAFLHNNWVGLVITLGIATAYLL